MTSIIAATAPTFTRPADVTAYAAGDLVANSVTAASVVVPVFTFPFGRSLQIKHARLVKSTNGVSNPAFRLNLFSVVPTFQTAGDNGLLSADLIGAANFIGSLSIGGSFSVGSDGAGAILLPFSNTSPYDGPIVSSTVYGILEALAAYAPGSAETFSLTLFGEVLEA